jgi:hypothetical protein
VTTIGEQIQGADDVICGNIASLSDQRELLSQNVLAQLRNLVEGVAVLLHAGQPTDEYNYATIDPALAFVRSKGHLNFIGKFHKLIQVSSSHYTLDGDASERLMLKYYEYLHRIRSLLRERCSIEVLSNLEAFPVDLDPSLREYHEKIAAAIEVVRAKPIDTRPGVRYYIHRTKPFFVGGHIYYEVTFFKAVNKVSKFDRVIAFTDIDMSDKYSAWLTLESESITVLHQQMPITIIRDWQVSIRPCEFDNFARLFDIDTKVRTNGPEYRYLMKGLTSGHGSLLELMDMPDAKYAAAKEAATGNVSKPQIFPVLDEARRIILEKLPGHNIIRYLMLRMRNHILKPQYAWDGCPRLSGLKLQWGCIPFEEMPFCTSPMAHIPRYWDLVECLDATGRNHELLARRVKNNVEQRAVLYTPVAELEDLGDVSQLIRTYNQRLYYKHRDARGVELDKGHVFIRKYEDDTVAIVEKLQEFASSGIDGYTDAVEHWLDQTPRLIDDDIKKDALKRLFSQSKVALVYGAAGTGKSTMVDHIANYFNDKTKLFLAHTNPAVDNLKRRVTAQDSTFRTIRSQTYQGGSEYDLMVIDESSTVSNADLIRILNSTTAKLVVLVGDVYQIEAIEFGNWFSIIRSFIPGASVFELTTPFRTKNPALLGFWQKVRDIDDDIAEVIARNGYSSVLDKSLFEAQGDDEIILCLNYDGLYGINNINRFLQSSNPGKSVRWGIATYKVGDPVLFNEIDRFKPVIYNNLKGRITAIELFEDHAQFDVELDRDVSEFDVDGVELQWVANGTVRFSVYDYDISDDDDDSTNTVVPFQVAYAVSIHKAQGLEYDSVKVVITDANEDAITHNIFYTAVTRARESLRIFWTPETQQAVLHGLKRDVNTKDVALLSRRRGLIPVRVAP